MSMKRWIKRVLPILLALTLTGGAASGCTGVDPYSEGKTIISFWGHGDDAETKIYSDMIDKFNAQSEIAYVEYTKKPGGESYTRATGQALGGSRPPDVVLAGETQVKQWAASNLLFDMKRMVDASAAIDTDDLWDDLMKRYQFDTSSWKHSKDAPIWGLPKDLGSTVIYYNENLFEEEGITIVRDTPIEAVENADERFGFYEKNQKLYFNNRIPMTWEELVRLCKLFTKGYNANAFTDYGYYTPWWFAFGWSVGGNVIQHIDDDDPAYNDGYYAFTLGDEKANYIVKDGVDALTLTNGRVYRAGELIEYADRDALTAGEKASLTALPSMREAFDFFITLSTGNNPKYGIGKPIAAKPSDVTSGEYALFSDEKVAMYTDGRFAVPTFRRDCDFKWDAAPLPKFASGIKAGHSTSMCYSIARTSKNLDAAFELIEYLAGPNGQAELIDSGFNVPTYKSVTATQRFMKPPSGVYPQNSFAFSDAAAYQTQGDWGFLPDDAWIREWAPTVNGDLRNGKKANGTAYTVNDFFADSKLFVNTDDVLKAYTRK